MTLKSFFLTALIVILLAGFFLVTAPDGAEIFKKEGCVNCHSFKNHHEGIGPDLTDVYQTRSDKWLKEHILNPKIHNPHSGMPNFGHLSKREIKALIKYLKN